MFRGGWIRHQRCAWLPMLCIKVVFLTAPAATVPVAAAIAIPVAATVAIAITVIAAAVIAAAVVADAVVRLIPGVLGDDTSSEVESFSGDGKRIESPHYTRPAKFRDLPVPDVLLSGNHKAIDDWRDSMADERTRKNRPDLME